MPRFAFEAKSLVGKQLKGFIEAKDPSDAKNILRSKQLILLTLTLSNQATSSTRGLSLFNFRKKVKVNELLIFTKQFAVLIDAGIPIVQSLESMVGGGKSVAFNNVLKKIISELKSGKKLSESMKSFPSVFDKLYINMIKVGEESGNIKEVLNLLYNYIEKAMKLRKKVIGALTYPIISLLLSLLVVIGIFIFVIPKYQQMFSSQNKELPDLTKLVIQMSEFTQSSWYVIVLALIAIPIGFSTFYSNQMGKKILDSLFLRVPVFKDLIIKSDLARFSRNFSTLLTSGLRIIQAVQLSVETIKNETIKSSLSSIKETILKGRSLSEPLRQSKYMPQTVIQMIDIGEKAGNLDSMVARVADFYEDEVEVTVDVMTELINPLLMVFLGFIIGFLMLVINLPVFKMTEAFL